MWAIGKAYSISKLTLQVDVGDLSRRIENPVPESCQKTKNRVVKKDYALLGCAIWERRDIDLFFFQVRPHGGAPHEFVRSTDASSTTKTQKSYLADNRTATSSVNR